MVASSSSLRFRIYSASRPAKRFAERQPNPRRGLGEAPDLMIQFHQFAPEEEWALIDGTVPIAADGLVGCNARLWTPDGRLLASGTSKHTCRPNPRYEEEVAQAKELGLIR